MKLSKQEQKYQARQQLANKFMQKESRWTMGYYPIAVADKNAVKKLVNKICK